MGFSGIAIPLPSMLLLGRFEALEPGVVCIGHWVLRTSHKRRLRGALEFVHRFYVSVSYTHLTLPTKA